MSFINKKFTDLMTSQVIEVVDQFENIAVLSNQQRIDVRRLLNEEFYEPYIDPKEFFSNSSTYNLFVDKVKSIPQEALQNMDDSNDSSVIIEEDPEMEMKRLQEKANQMMGNSSEAAKKQLEMLGDILDPDEFPQVHSDFSQDRPSSTTVVQPVVENQPVMNPQTNVNNVESDPIKNLFKNVKRNNKLKFSINIEELIPRPDFIEMMEDSYEVSIIDYLSNDILSKILSDKNSLKEKIKEEINKIVYTKKPISKRTIPSVPAEDRINSDGSTNPKKTRTKKVNQ